MPTPSPEFPEYSVKYSRDAIESRKLLPPELLTKLDNIVNGLATDPNKYPERIIPASRDGTSFVYRQPDPDIQVTFELDEEKKIIYFFHFSAPTFAVKKTIFVSYSHEDEEWLKMVKKFLAVLEQEGLIEFWDDSRIDAGDKWKSEIEDALEGAKAAVLLVSQSFLASNFVSTYELPKILANASQGGKKVFWIPLSPSTVFDTHKEITQFQSLMTDPTTSLKELKEVDRQKVLVQMSKKLRDAVSH